jgi:nifR3 family TIM-barrel protein
MFSTRLYVQGLVIEPPLLLAPMAGLTHSALRTLLLDFGGTGLLSTEMLGARRLPCENPRLSPYLFRTGSEKPLSYQLLLTDAAEVQPAVDALHRLKADAVDLNLGCPAPRVRKSGGGSALMDDVQRVRTIVAAVRRATRLPLSAKIRLGERFDENKLKNFCRMLEGEGIDYLTVHARLRGEPFSRPPHWQWVARVKGWLSIPVIANGGILSRADARQCLRISRADGLMIGRAAAFTPWIFADIARRVYGSNLPEPSVNMPLLYIRFARALVERFLPERRLGRLKEFTHYFSSNYAFGHSLAMSVQNSAALGPALQRALAFFKRHDREQAEAAIEEYMYVEELLVREKSGASCRD